MFGNKSIAATYREKVGGESEAEKDILAALLSSYTSLFKITSINKSTLLLEDILNKKGDIPLMDIALSKTAAPGMLLFTRLIPFEDFNMTSGAGFVFPAGLEEYLLRRYKKLSKKVESGNESVKRFVAFYKLSKSSGLEVKYEAKNFA